LATPRSSRQRTSPATNDLFPGDSAQADPTAATIAKRFSALARNDVLLRRADLIAI
jgi:hypothetical protein